MSPASRFRCTGRASTSGSGYQGTLGHAYPSALGAEVARPEQAVVALAGDGGFMYNVQELATAVLHGINVVALVFNDGAYGNVRRMQRELYGNRVIASDLVNPDFVRLADSFGVFARSAEDPDGLLRRSRAGACRGRARPDRGQGRRVPGPLAAHRATPRPRLTIRARLFEGAAHEAHISGR